MNCLIIGYGSIGSRHAAILNELGCNVHVVSARDIRDVPCYKSVKEALENRDFDYVIISNETWLHYKSFVELRELGYSGKLLIEKPLFSKVHPFASTGDNSIFVAYDLRFHPVIQRLRDVLEEGELYSIQVYVGQYLPSWRPGTDYTKCYSASKERGGGVLRDLSHELDYINWICGGWKRVTAIGGKFSDLQIDSDDIFVLLLEMENCPVACIQMNYLDRKARREIIVNAKGHSIKADLILNTLEIDGKMTRLDVERNLSYVLQHQAILNGDFSTACTYQEGIDVLNLIEFAELASRKKIWFNRSDLEGTF